MWISNIHYLIVP